MFKVLHYHIDILEGVSVEAKTYEKKCSFDYVKGICA